jgi:Reverse transcriptase (RNA-dependent DNA polymerase)
LALAFRQRTQLSEAGPPSPYWVLARGGKDLVGSVYIPGQGGSKILSALGKTLRGKGVRKGVDQIFLVGDWNMSAQKALARIANWGITDQFQFKSIPFSGSSKTCHGHRRKTWSSIDYAIVGNRMDPKHMEMGQVTAVVDRSWELSDHWPVLTRLTQSNPVSSEEQAQMRRMIRSRLVEERQTIATSNRWEPLLWLMRKEQEQEREDVDKLANVLDETCWNLAQEIKAVKSGTVPPSSTTMALSKSTLTEIHNRRKQYQTWISCEEGQAEMTEKAKYLEQRKQTRGAVKKDLLKAWKASIFKGSEALRTNQSKTAWTWVQRAIGSPSRNSGGGGGGPKPVFGLDNQLKTTVTEIAEAWAGHYGALAADQTGHSRDSLYWRNMDTSSTSQRPSLSELDEELTWREVNKALWSLKSGKAAGSDGIVPEMVQAARGTNRKQSCPDTLMGKVMMEILTRIWMSGNIPSNWETAIVVSIPKKGDESNMDNYRGISLIPVVLKLLSTVVARRISQVAEKNGLLAKEQAGFRDREECMGQIIALYEIAKRRWLDGSKKTYVAFIDFKKAYDRVPQEALFHKMEQAGWVAEGRCMTFLRALYQGSKMSVRVNAETGARSPAVQLLRGLRQGCPLSPVLFDLFINDALCGMQGVDVPGKPKGLPLKCPGLLFADDLVLLANSTMELQLSLKRMEEWANRWEMEVGATKCGILCLHGSINDLGTDPGMWKLQGQIVPKLSNYTYLGWKITDDMGLDGGLEERARLGMAVVQSQNRFLCSKWIPSPLKQMVLRSILIPTLTYGGELTGMCRDRVQKLSKPLEIGLRWIAGMSGDSHATSMATLHRAYNMAPVASRAAYQRARAYRKYRSLRTWIATLILNPPKSQQKTWTSGSITWLKTRKMENQSDKKVMEDDWHRWEGGRTETARRYAKANFGASIKRLNKAELKFPQWTTGFGILHKMRNGAFWSAQRLARIGKLGTEYKTKCPCCKVEGQPETDDHILLVCRTWDCERVRCLGERFGKLGGVDGHSIDPLGVSTCVLGGNGIGETSQLVVVRQEGNNLQNYEGSTKWKPPELHQVAAYLDSIASRRMQMINACGNSAKPAMVGNDGRPDPPPRAKAQLGRAPLIPAEVPR